MVRPLHKAEHPWKPSRIEETDDSAVSNDQFLIRKARSILNRVTYASKETLFEQFIKLEVYKTPDVVDIVSIIFEKAIEDPIYGGLYAQLCLSQIEDEVATNLTGASKFRNALLARVQDTFSRKNMDELARIMQNQINYERNADSKRLMQLEMAKEEYNFMRRKFKNIEFIGCLFMQQLIPVRIVQFCVVDLLMSVFKNPNPTFVQGYNVDVDSVECAVLLLENIGKRLEHYNALCDMRARENAEEEKALRRLASFYRAEDNETQIPFPFDYTFDMLDDAMKVVGNRIRFKILDLKKLRENGWESDTIYDEFLDDARHEVAMEQMKLQHEPIFMGIPMDVDEETWAPQDVEGGDRVEAVRCAILEEGTEQLDEKAQFWKTKYEDLEKKYRRLLMMLGKEKRADK